MAYHVGAAFDSGYYLLQGVPGLVGESHAVFDLLGAFSHRVNGLAGLGLYGAYHPAYFLSGLGGPFSQLPDLVGDDREAPALLSGPGRPRGAAAGHQVGLVGYVVV